MIKLTLFPLYPTVFKSRRPYIFRHHFLVFPSALWNLYYTLAVFLFLKYIIWFASSGPLHLLCPVHGKSSHRSTHESVLMYSRLWLKCISKKRKKASPPLYILWSFIQNEYPHYLLSSNISFFFIMFSTTWYYLIYCFSLPILKLYCPESKAHKCRNLVSSGQFSIYKTYYNICHVVDIQ